MMTRERTGAVPGRVTVALAGNPNSGKTTLFNALTGARQHVGNYPGVTVEKKEATVTTAQDSRDRSARHVQLDAYSPEELVARNVVR